MTKVVNVKNFDEGNYKKWLQENNKEDGKAEMLEYLATVMGEGKEAWEKYKNGEIPLENINVANTECDIDKAVDKVTDEEIAGFKRMFEGLSIMVGNEKPDLLDEIDDKSIRVIFLKAMSDFGSELMNVGESILKMALMCAKMKALMDLIFGGKKPEEEKEDEEVVQ